MSGKKKGGFRKVKVKGVRYLLLFVLDVTNLVMVKMVLFFKISFQLCFFFNLMLSFLCLSSLIGQSLLKEGKLHVSY